MAVVTTRMLFSQRQDDSGGQAFPIAPCKTAFPADSALNLPCRRYVEISKTTREPRVAVDAEKAVVSSERDAEESHLHLRLFGESYASITKRLDESRRLRSLPWILEQELGNPEFSLPHAARRCHLSENHFNLLLIQRCGWSFHRLLVRVRLLRACQKLKATDSVIKEVAYVTGFGSLRTFLRQFERVLGESPSQFRNRRRHG